MKRNNLSRRISTGDASDDVPEELRALYDVALAEFGNGHYRRALAPLGRLALALPLSHALRPTTRAALARAFLEVGQLTAAKRQLAHALGEEPNNPTYRSLQRMLNRAMREAHGRS